MNTLSFLSFGFDGADVALFLDRFAAGSFFAISGFHKLFNKQRHADLVATFSKLRIPLLRVNAWFVPCVECAAGALLTIGFLSGLSALLLGAICLVATCTDGLERVRSWNPINAADYYDTVLYLPEVIYGIALLVILLAGPGFYSIDHHFMR